MSGRQTIRQRIAFDGGEEMKAQLKALGEVGEKAFQKIEAATKQADFAKLGASLNRVGADLATVGKRLALAFGAITTAAGAAGAAVLVMAKSGAEAADSAGKAAQAAGMQVDAFGRLAYAAKLADLSQEELGAGMSRLNKAISAAALGSKNESDLFKRLGVSLRDAKGHLRPTEAVLQDVAQAFKRMPDGARKSALAMELFGKSGAKMLPFLNAGKQGLIDLGKEAERLGIVFTKEQVAIAEDMNDTLTGLGKAVSGVRMQMGLLFAPAITTGTKALRDMIVRNRAAILDFANGAIRQATVLVGDFFAALSGRDADVQNRWIIEWRDSIVQFGKDALSVVNGVVLPAFKLVREAATGVTAAINSLFGTNLSGGQLLLTASLIQLIGGFRLLKSTIMLAVEAIALLSRAMLANPWTIALAGVAGGIALWATRTGEATRALQVHQDLVGKVRDAYDQAGRKVAEMTQQVKDQALIQARLSQEAANKGLSAAIDDAINAIEQFDGLLPHAADKLFEVFKQFKNTRDVQAFREEVSRLGAASPELGKLAQQFLDLTQAPHKLAQDAAESANWINLYTGAITDSQFAQRQAALGIAGYSDSIKNSATDIRTAGEAVAQTNAKVEDLGKTITVTKFGANGPVKQVYEFVDGVARAVDQSKTSLGDLEQSASQTSQAIQGVSSEVAGAIRSVPEAFRSDTATAAVDSVVADVDRIAPAAQQAAGQVQTALAGIGNIDNGTAAQAADAILKPFEDLPSKIDAILTSIKGVAQGGFSALAATVRQMSGEITTMINSIISALRQAAAEASKLRSSASSSSSSRSGRGFSRGGFLGSGPGTSTSDSIPAWLSVGEFVVQAAAVRKFGVDFFADLNRGLMPAIKGFSGGGIVNGLRARLSSFNIPQFASGGLVEHALASAGGGAAMKSFDLHLHTQGGTQVFTGLMSPAETAAQLQRHVAGKTRISVGRKPGWYR
ncbi:uncharacterized protein YukE [Mesorhizobium soli]|uniref:hypothetical protein n=1 Tax=Pseudaminobacter soli (ex Li et al. 2025) TaxID=1295366 RepID=UPI0024754679|nr:hypothetical protein [Mesorhizobium soli]MDH6235149.1 uncharacterized protein YukE [Mesorhizobium soli]